MEIKTQNTDIKKLLCGEITYDAIASGRVPINDPKIGDMLKLSYIQHMEDESVMFSASEEAINLFREYVEDLIDAGNLTAMTAKAFCCYGGNRAYGKDWFVSRDLMEQVLEKNCDPYVANALGYIYYYGRCNDGVPQYDKAFYYFSIGSAEGIFESRYKISDMFYHGRAVPKNIKLSANIVSNLYLENLDIFRSGAYDGKFADLALRMSNLDIQRCFQDESYSDYEIKPEVDDDGYSINNYDAAYFFLLQAKLAITLRMKVADLYGDKDVLIAIEEQIDKIYKKCSFKGSWNPGGLTFASIAAALDSLLKKPFDLADPMYRANFVIAEDGQRLLIVETTKYLEDSNLDFLITIPDVDYCELLPALCFLIEGDGNITIGSNQVVDGESVTFNSWDNNTLICSFDEDKKMVFDNNLEFTIFLTPNENDWHK